MTEDRQLVAARARLVARSGIGLVLLAAVLGVLAFAGVPLVGFIGLALLTFAAFVPKVVRDLRRVLAVLDGHHREPIQVEVRSQRTGRFGGRDIVNVWADVYPPDSSTPCATVPVGAVLSGVPSKTRALTIDGRTAATAIGQPRPGELVALDTPAGLVLPSGPSRSPTARR